MEDTDSMAIVATEDGGFFACPGGDHRTEDTREALKALTWQQVDRIRGRFQTLDPYGIDEPILKLEEIAKQRYGF